MPWTSEMPWDIRGDGSFVCLVRVGEVSDGVLGVRRGDKKHARRKAYCHPG